MAGLAAHLAGAVASKTVYPNRSSWRRGPIKWHDALLTVQMPKGIPNSGYKIGSAGATNSAFLAAQILGIESEAK